MNDVIFEAYYENVILGIYYRIQFFGTTRYAIPRPTEIIELPMSVVEVESVEHGIYEIPFDMPKAPTIKLNIDISELDLSDANHSTFLNMCVKPNLWELKPTVIVYETSKINMVENQTFAGKINTSGANGVAHNETKIQLKLEHIVYHTMKSMNLYNYNPFYWEDTQTENVFSKIANFCTAKDRPFAYYFNIPAHNYRRLMGLFFPRPSAILRQTKQQQRTATIAGTNETKNIKEWWDLGRSYIRFIKLTDFLEALSSFVNQMIMRLQMHQRQQ